MLSVYLLSQAGVLESFQMPCRLAGWPPERLEQGGIVAFGKSGDAFVGGPLGGGGGTEVERHAAEERLVILEVGGAQRVVALVADGGERGGVARLGIRRDVAEVDEVGGSGEDGGVA